MQTMNNPYFKDLPYQEISKKVVYQGKRLKVEEVEYLDGEKIIHREHVKAGNAIIILPITEDNKVIMVQEPRTPIGKVILDLPAGMIESGEEPSKAAIRELEEETGYLANKIEFLREYYQTVGYSDEKIQIYLATHLRKTKQHLDEDEEIRVIEIPLEEAIQMLNKNEIATASANIAFMHYLLYKNK